MTLLLCIGHSWRTVRRASEVEPTRRMQRSGYVRLLWSPCVADADIIFLPCGFFPSILLSIFFPRLISAVGDWMSIPYTWCGLTANLECMSEMCCTRLAGNTLRKNEAKNRDPSGLQPTTLSDYIVATEERIDNREIPR